LRGLPLWSAGRAADMLWLSFGARRPAPTDRRPDREVGEWAVHLECPWRISAPDGVKLPATKGGHAWVLFNKGGETFLLEAVATSQSRMIQSLTAVARRYRPEYGVGRDLKTFAFAGMAETYYEREFSTRRKNSTAC
jgi:hypothetical protein